MPVKTRIVVGRDRYGDFQATVQKKGLFFWRSLKTFTGAWSDRSDYVEKKAQEYIDNISLERTYLYPWSDK